MKKFLIIPLLALLASSCQDEGQTNAPIAKGEEVRFGGSLDQGVKTRTIYGPEANSAFPIYWINGDQVVVSSPDCASNGGVGTATYKVTVDNPTQNYATSLDKTGEIGVRWGKNATGDFYSVYPAAQTKVGTDYKTMTLTMPGQQDCDIVVENGKKTVRPDMDACFMYAKTAGVKSGEIVNLKYTPISTALRFTLVGPKSGSAVTVSRIELHAPEGVDISGQFQVDLSSANGTTLPTTSVVKGTNVVTVTASNPTTHENLTLNALEEVELNAFFFLTKETNIDNTWSIVVRTGDGNVFTKSLGSQTGGKTTLVPGKIHRLPKLPALSEPGEWNPANWMVNIDRNVYLSEISLPGSWNSMNGDSQKNTDIDAQYKAGVRAFHIDTRWKAANQMYWNCGDLGVADGGYSTDHRGFGASGRIMRPAAPTFEASLKKITDHVQPNEYMVVICTFAQNSYDNDRSSGGWERRISDVCANNDKVMDGSKLSANSVVQDVLGKVIVIVNTANSHDIANSKCLFMNMGMTLDQNAFTSQAYYSMNLLQGNNAESGISLKGTHAQIMSNTDAGFNDDSRGYRPSFAEREAKCGNILNWAKANYADQTNYAHNAWMYLGLGGYTNDNEAGYEEVAAKLNGWIDGKITEMKSGGYYPIGIILMNNATNYSSVLKNIMLLNNTYIKAYDPNRSPFDGSDVSKPAYVQSVAPGYDSGMTNGNTNAFGWTKRR